MHAALIVLASLFTDVTPPPTELVLAGCTTSSAIRAAEIRLTSPHDARMPVLLDELLRNSDGALCLLESEVLVQLHQSGRARELVTQAFVAGLNVQDAPAKGRAWMLAARIRVADPGAYDEIVRRAEDARGVWRELGRDPMPLTHGEVRSALRGAADVRCSGGCSR